MKKLLNKLKNLFKRAPRYHAYVTANGTPKIRSFNSRKERELYIVEAVDYAVSSTEEFWVDALIEGEIEWPKRGK